MRMSRINHLWIVTALIGLLGTAFGECGAQVIRGRITVRGTNEPVASGIASLVDSAGRVMGTTLADDHGSFILTAPASGRYAVRAERVGFRSVTTPLHDIVFGQTIEVNVAVSGENVTLRGIKVTADRRCVVRPTEGLAAAQLWDEARKALNATALTQMAQATARQRRDPHRFTVRIRKFVRTLEPRTLAERHARAYEVEGESITPFMSHEPERLAREGYVVGGQEAGMTFYAPDATVLLSDSFLDGHCFRVQAPGRGRRDDLIGLAFEPVPRITRLENLQSRYVDVRGVLWLDRSTAELRYMEYDYANLRLEVPAEDVGGQIEFRPLPDGRWVVWRWYIRMPRLERQRIGDPLTATATGWRVGLNSIEEEGGEILEVLPPGSRRVGPAAVTGVVYDGLRPGPMSGARVFLSGTSFAASTGPDGRYRIDSVPPGRYTVSVLATRFDSLLLDAPMKQVAVSAGEDTEADFGIPEPATLYARWCTGVPMADTLGVVLGIVRDTSALLAAGVKVTVEWSNYSKPQPDRLAIRPITVEGTTGRDGRYALCGLPTRRPVTVRASRDRSLLASSQIRLEPGEVRRVDLSLKER
jgi:carboxypeptidase family protein